MFKLQGVPKKMVFREGFQFLTLGGVFLGVKNNSKNFGTQINRRTFITFKQAEKLKSQKMKDK